MIAFRIKHHQLSEKQKYFTMISEIIEKSTKLNESSNNLTYIDIS